MKALKSTFTALTALATLAAAGSIATPVAQAREGVKIGFELKTDTGERIQYMAGNFNEKTSALLASSLLKRAVADGHTDGYFKYRFDCALSESAGEGAVCTTEDFTDRKLGFKKSPQLDPEAANLLVLLLNMMLKGESAYSGFLECVGEEDQFLCTMSRVQVL